MSLAIFAVCDCPRPWRSSASNDLTLAQKMPLAFANMAFNLRKMGWSVRFMRLAQLGRGVFIICPQGFGNLSACYFVSSEKSVRLSVKP